MKHTKITTNQTIFKLAQVKNKVCFHKMFASTIELWAIIVTSTHHNTYNILITTSNVVNDFLVLNNTSQS